MDMQRDMVIEAVVKVLDGMDKINPMPLKEFTSKVKENLPEKLAAHVKEQSLSSRINELARFAEFSGQEPLAVVTRGKYGGVWKGAGPERKVQQPVSETEVAARLAGKGKEKIEAQVSIAITKVAAALSCLGLNREEVISQINEWSLAYANKGIEFFNNNPFDKIEPSKEEKKESNQDNE